MNVMQQLVQMVKTGNPQQVLMNTLQQSNNNPILNNVLNLAQKGDTKGIEELARNLARERGVNVEDAMTQVKQQFGIQ